MKAFFIVLSNSVLWFIFLLGSMGLAYWLGSSAMEGVSEINLPVLIGLLLTIGLPLLGLIYCLRVFGGWLGCFYYLFFSPRAQLAQYTKDNFPSYSKSGEHSVLREFAINRLSKMNATEELWSFTDSKVALKRLVETEVDSNKLVMLYKRFADQGIINKLREFKSIDALLTIHRDYQTKSNEESIKQAILEASKDDPDNLLKVHAYFKGTDFGERVIERLAEERALSQLSILYSTYYPQDKYYYQCIVRNYVLTGLNCVDTTDVGFLYHSVRHYKLRYLLLGEINHLNTVNKVLEHTIPMSPVASLVADNPNCDITSFYERFRFYWGLILPKNIEYIFCVSNRVQRLYILLIAYGYLELDNKATTKEPSKDIDLYIPFVEDAAALCLTYISERFTSLWNLALEKKTKELFTLAYLVDRDKFDRVIKNMVVVEDNKVTIVKQDIERKYLSMKLQATSQAEVGGVIEQQKNEEDRLVAKSLLQHLKGFDEKGIWFLHEGDSTRNKVNVTGKRMLDLTALQHDCRITLRYDQDIRSIDSQLANQIIHMMDPNAVTKAKSLAQSEKGKLIPYDDFLYSVQNINPLSEHTDTLLSVVETAVKTDDDGLIIAVIDLFQYINDDTVIDMISDHFVSRHPIELISSISNRVSDGSIKLLRRVIDNAETVYFDERRMTMIQSRLIDLMVSLANNNNVLSVNILEELYVSMNKITELQPYLPKLRKAITQAQASSDLVSIQKKNNQYSTDIVVKRGSK